MLTIKIIEISILKIFVKIFFVLMIFLPLILYGFNIDISNTLVGAWILLCIISYLVLQNIQKPYRIIGQISFNNDHILMSIKEIKSKIIINKNVCINIKYRGFRGENIKYNFPLFYSFVGKTGIGDIIINNNKSSLKLMFLADSNKILEELTNAQKYYSNNNIDFKIDKTDVYNT